MAVFVAKSALDQRWTGRHRVRKAFPGQNVPRDDHGRWTDDGVPAPKPTLAELFAESRARIARTDKLTEDIINAPKQRAIFESGTKRVVFSRSLNPEYDLRVTTFDNGEPIGHREYKLTDVSGLRSEVSMMVGGKWNLTTLKTFDESKHPRDEHGRWVDVPDEPGTVPIPEGHVRLYHQTTEAAAEDIRVHGIRLDRAKGIEGPRAIYADEKGFYGKPGSIPTVEFHVAKDRWNAPFVRADSEVDSGRVAPENIIAIHYPWHAQARYLENDPEAKAKTLSGKFDHLLDDPEYGPAVRYIKRKYGKAIAKAGPDDVAELERLLRQSDQLTAQVRQAFLDAVQRLGDRVDVDALRALLENGRIGEAMQVVNAQSVTQGYGPLIDAITAGTITAARSGALANMTAGAEFSFSQTNPEAIGFLRDYEMNLIRELTADTLASVRAVILDGVNAGRHPFAIARDVRDFIGLTERQTRAVMNYRRALEQGDGDALARQLRDRRFDPSVRRAVRGDRALSVDQIDTMVERYRQRYLRYRSETIARTEAKRSLGAGNQLLWQQAVADGKVDADQVTKKWTTVGDHKVRSSHVALNGQVVGLNESFQSPEGPIMYPGDPNASASMTINCRCTPIFRFKLKATEE